MFQSGPNDMTRQRMLQARALSKEARGVGLNLGKKISVPKDVMMEELNLPSNRGSRMFQERQKRVERFTLENAADGAYNTNNVHLEAIPPPQIIPEQQGGKEHQAFSIPGKHSLVMNLQKTVAKKGSPDILAPGYSGPLKEIPHERFNTTVIPKSYCSPWREALGKNEELLIALNAQLPQVPQRLPSASYRCFNSLKINPVSGLHLLGVRLRDGYFEPWLLKDDPLGGLRAVNVPSKTDCARKGITFLMAHKELHHTSEEEQRSAVPFGGALASNRVIPVIGFEAMELQDLPSVSLKSMCQRPSFNRAPRGWGINQGPESNEL